MKKIQYTQCRLRRNDTYQVSWIPTQFAIIGKSLEIREDDGSWQPNWTVISMGMTVDADFLLKVLHLSHKKTRECSDI